MVSMLVWVTLAGCHRDRGEGYVTPPERLYLTVADQTLASAVVGERYDAVIAASGGNPPYVFSAVQDPPGGLTLTADGHLKGRIAQAGSTTFQVLVSDAMGRSKIALITVNAVLEPLVVQCGETVSGRFTDDAMGPGGMPDLAVLDGLAWLAVDLPDEPVTRVDLTFDNDASSVLYVEQPNELLGSWDITNHYVAKAVDATAPSTVSIDAGTDPSLTGFATQELLPMVLVGQSTGDWSVSVECSDGPVFTTLLQYPTEQGTPFLYDFDVYGSDNTVARIWTDDPLPRWMVWDEVTGIVTSDSGLAEQPGTWEITIQAETPDGRHREERAIFGVYDVREVPCGGRIDLTVDEGYFDGEFTGYYDPKGFDVFRVDLAGRAPSSILLSATGSDGHYLGLADPAPDWLKFYGGAERVYVEGPASIVVEPRTYPASHHYADEGELFFSAASIGSILDGVELSVECDDTPLPDLAAFPVLAPLDAIDLPLDAIGGEPPYAWGATGLPAGLQLQRDGRLTGTTSITGTFPVTLTVTDKNDAQGSRTYDLRVGSDDACLGFKRVYCGDSISNEFTEAYYNDSGSKESTRTFCYVDDSDRTLGIELYSDDGQYRVDVADPGVDDPDQVTDAAHSTYVAFVDRGAVEGVSLDSFSWPNLDDYQGLPVFVTLRAYDPGEWTAHFVCTP